MSDERTQPTKKMTPRHEASTNSSANCSSDLLKHLPSDDDRKSTMGCLAAVLALHNLYANEKIVDSDGGKVVNETSMYKSFRGPAVVGASFPTRDKAFQAELLNVCADLLLLSPDCAANYIPILDIGMVSNNMEDQEDQEQKQRLLLPFLDTFSSEAAAFKCITMLLFRFIMISNESNAPAVATSKATEVVGKHERTIIGYDARARYAFKCLTVSVLSYFAVGRGSGYSSIHGNGGDASSMERDRVASCLLRQSSAEAYATRKFEALEDDLSEKLLFIARMVALEGNQHKQTGGINDQTRSKSISQKLVRGLKIGASGVAAGTLFAVTGGMAAPAIAAGIASVAGAGVIASATISLLTLPAATTIFGLGGGSLVMRKVSSRTKGLSEFEVTKEDNSDFSPELARTVCISGWLTDEYDFQRPFGVTPDNLTDKQELLGRFCSVYAPFTVPKCRSMIKQWKGKEDDLWDILRTNYGKDPDSLFPLSGPRQDAALTDSETHSVNDLIETLGFPIIATPEDSNLQSDSSFGSGKPSHERKTISTVSLLTDVLTCDKDEDGGLSDECVRAYKAWDFHAHYGGEQYTVRWEKDLLLQLDSSAKDFAGDLAKNATGQVLQKTALRSLMAAVALPATLLSLTHIIDEKWTLVAERADEAGVALAQSLLDSNGGHRPVSLVGFSFGARIIYSCLEELARHQVLWEENAYQRRKGYNTNRISGARGSMSGTSAPRGREPASVVEDVVLMGCPASVSNTSWIACRHVVAGRLINCYSSNDLMLALVYRVKNLRSVLSPPVGIREVNVQGVENVDVSSTIDSHRDYCVAVRDILEMVGYGQPRQCDRKGLGQGD